jgi:hypothetical protein
MLFYYKPPISTANGLSAGFGMDALLPTLVAMFFISI